MRLLPPLLFLLCRVCGAKAKENITLLSLSPRTSLWGLAITPAVDMAFLHVNEDASILPNHRLVSVALDTGGCSDAVGMKRFVDALGVAEEQRPLGIASVVCSRVAQPVASLAAQFQMATMSGVAASATLSDKKLFPLFLRTMPPDTHLAPAMVALARHFGWKRVATITEVRGQRDIVIQGRR